jgi:endonuclease YncB( thermonuclease family)
MLRHRSTCSLTSRSRTHLVEGKTVRLACEPARARVDKYGRLLAYLYLEPGGLFVNREIVAKGFGHAYTEYPFQSLADVTPGHGHPSRGVSGPE